MISYFKYTDGNAFTLSGSDYLGMFNITNDTPYTGSTRTSNSLLLSSKDNFLARIYYNKYNFSYNYGDVIKIDTPKFYPRTILTVTNLIDVVNRLYNNNLLIYSSMITYDSDLLNVYSKSSPNDTSIVFCLTSTNDSLSGKRLPLTRFEVSSASMYASFRDNIRASNASASIFTSFTNNTFKYYNTNYMLSGNFNNTSIQTLVSSSTIIPNVDTSYIAYNKYQNIIYNTTFSGNKYNIYYFDSSTACLTSALFDRVDISAINSVGTNLHTHTYGKTYRTAIVYDQGAQIIEISKVNSSEQVVALPVNKIGFDSIISICQRFEDDALAVYGILAGELTLCLYDITDLIYNIFSPTYISTVINSTLRETIEFSVFDSDIVTFTRYDSERCVDNFEFRSVSNAKYPLIQINGLYCLGFLQQETPVINKVYVNVENVNINCGISDVLAHRIYDVKFDVTSTLNNIIFYRDSYETYSTSSVLNTLVPLNLKSNFNVDFIPSDNSIGITLNDYFKGVIKDTFNIYKVAKSKFAINDYSVINSTVATNLSNINDLNLRLYENENFNVGTLNRIIEGITQIQSNIASSFSTAL